MDAQHVEPPQTQPASPKRASGKLEQKISARIDPPSRRSSPVKDWGLHASMPHVNEDDDGAGGNSDAETIVLPGRDGLSPSKVRKMITHEEKGEKGEKGDCEDKGDRSVNVSSNGSRERGPPLGTKKKSFAGKSRSKDGSSGLSSVPASPPKLQARRSSHAHSASESEVVQAKSPGGPYKEASKTSDKLVTYKRMAPRAESEDEAGNQKIRRQRASGSGLNASRKKSLVPIIQPEPQAVPLTTGSVSPQARTHGRSISQHSPPYPPNGLGQKKKRIPAPLQSTEYQSDDSSASGSPHPRSSRIRALATPSNETVSPAKMAPHKKHLDAHGQTFLARACAKGEYEISKQRLQERPEDINVADYAGNTPLQISALNGYDDIVKLLVDAGCYLDCVNNDKDTPLIDAVENGHLEVVRFLLDAGVNPRKANAYGQEPIDRVNENMDHADEIRRALRDARNKVGERRRTSEEHHLDHMDAHSSHGPESPRRSPGPGGSGGSMQSANSRRAGTVRSTKTSNHLLYMPMDDKTLRQAAAKGDEETVTRILQVRETFDDPESMVAAARGGHDIVMNLLLALGRANPDPGPISSGEYSTPMLAAIGQENVKVVKLLLDQNDFDPTRRFKGETYHELARRRRGPNWMEEETLLKKAYDEYRRTFRDASKTKSPNRREKGYDGQRDRNGPTDESAGGHKQKTCSPTREPSKRLGSTKTLASPREEYKVSHSFGPADDQSSPKRGLGKAKRDQRGHDRVPHVAMSDREASPVARLAHKPRRAESDMTAMSSEGEAARPRRKLVSARDLRGEQEKRRTSLACIAPIAPSLKDPVSPREESENTTKSEKYLDRTKALRRDESRESIPASGEGVMKRHRASMSPPHPGPGSVSADKESGEGPSKKRRLGTEEKEKRPRLDSPEDSSKTSPCRERDLLLIANPSSAIAASRSREEGERRGLTKARKLDTALMKEKRDLGKPDPAAGFSSVKAEDGDAEMTDAPHYSRPVKTLPPIDARFQVDKEKERDVEDKRKGGEADGHMLEAKRREDERRRVKQEEEVRRRMEEERRQQEGDERRRRAEQERKDYEDGRERKRRDEEERKRREERDRKLEEEKKAKEEMERLRREEEAALRREQLEREAVEEARRQREEEEQREQERRERRYREELERTRAAREAERAAHEAEQSRIRAEQERVRLSNLPPLLRWLDGQDNAKMPEIAAKFATMQGVRYDCIHPPASGSQDGREQWLINTQIALLLGEKDLQLTRYTEWQRKPVSTIAKRVIWRVESDRYALTIPGLYHLGKQLAGYYGDSEPERMSYRVTERLRGEAWEKFAAMDLFFVKASDFMSIVPSTPHLLNVKLILAYRELPDTEAELSRWAPLHKWRSDPDADRFYGFAPGNKYFMNGHMISEEKPGLSIVSTTPFPEKRVPRRGLVAVSPQDPDYTRMCREQGLEHLIIRLKSPLLANGVDSSPSSASSRRMDSSAGGMPSPTSMNPTVSNGSGNNRHPISPTSESGAQMQPVASSIGT